MFAPHVLGKRCRAWLARRYCAVTSLLSEPTCFLINLRSVCHLNQSYLCHIFTEWRQHYLAGTDLVCLSYDEGNAHNAVDRHVFLTRMQEVAPGLSRWLEYIYPTDLDTKVFYHKVIIRSAAGGQQGCPLRTACHAVVQRLLLESLGLIDPPAGSGVVLPVVQPRAQLDMAPCFADAAFGGGLACSSALVACPATPWSSSFSVLCCSGCWHFAPG